MSALRFPISRCRRCRAGTWARGRVKGGGHVARLVHEHITRPGPGAPLAGPAQERCARIFADGQGHRGPERIRLGTVAAAVDSGRGTGHRAPRPIFFTVSFGRRSLTALSKLILGFVTATLPSVTLSPLLTRYCFTCAGVRYALVYGLVRALQHRGCTRGIGAGGGGAAKAGIIVVGGIAARADDIRGVASWDGANRVRKEAELE